MISEKNKKNHIKILQNIIKKMSKYSDFYKKVWIACLEIPAGKTLTYKQIAEKVGSPKAARAVGTALANNPFAPLIPCHRVIRSDGKLGGYSASGGLKKKQVMLKYEKETGKNASLD
ncbi:MAG: MGMT family protein [Endomicrobium sp.]|jgi:O-6-methylguanine DNA methyltransferase|nr:MGMT family protein [Endomicrobium sp.]